MDIKFNVKKISEKSISKLHLVKNGDCGHFGRVYRFSDSECLKVFNEPFSDYRIKLLNEQTNFSFETVQMPKYLVKMKNKINGYVTDYVEGKRLCDSLDCDFSEFLKMYSKFIKKTAVEATEAKYMIVDASSKNVMIDEANSCIKLVDTDLWDKRKDWDYDRLIEQNFSELNGSIFNGFLFLLSYDIFDLTIHDDFIDYYETIREEIEHKKNVKIKTLGDLVKWK